MNADLIGVWLEKLFTGMLLLIGSSLPCPGFQSKHLSVKISVLVCVPLHTFTIKFIECGLSQHELVPDASISLCFYIYIYIYIMSPQHAHLSIHPPFCVFVWPYMNHRLHLFIYLVIHPSISLPLRHSWRPHSVFFPQSCSRRSRFLSLLACFNGLLKSSVDDLTKNGCFLIFLQRLIDTLSIRIISEAIQ